MHLRDIIFCIKTKMLKEVLLSPQRLLFALRTFKIVEVAQLLLGNGSVWGREEEEQWQGNLWVRIKIA